jgi:hypothetical protein
MILLVSYDLKQPDGSYSELFEALKGEESWWHYISSTWLISTDKSASQFSSELTNHIFKGDRLIVVEFPSGSAEYQGWLPRKAWNWIKSHRES